MEAANAALPSMAVVRTGGTGVGAGALKVRC